MKREENKRSWNEKKREKKGKGKEKKRRKKKKRIFNSVKRKKQREKRDSKKRFLRKKGVPARLDVSEGADLEQIGLAMTSTLFSAFVLTVLR